MLYGRPFLSNDLVTDPEIDSLSKYIRTFQQAIQKLRNKALPAPVKGGKLQIEPGEQVLSPGKKEPQLTMSSLIGRALI
jgi:hypothetical protein